MDEQFSQQVVADTVRWLERAVIGLNLCPFAKSPHVKGLIHCAVSSATEPGQLRSDLMEELQALVALEPQVRETTLLIAPDCLADFYDFNDFLAEADRVLRAQQVEGEIQIASFHPRYQFAGTQVDDIENFTNRSPYPMLHLIREASMDRAVEAFPQAEAIFETNMQTLRELGEDGWRALDVGAKSRSGHG
jgi:hypothetical protein